MTTTALELADLLRAYTPAFLDAYGDATSPEQRRVLRDLVRCRTAALGGHVEGTFSIHLNKIVNGADSSAGFLNPPLDAKGRPRCKDGK